MPDNRRTLGDTGRIAVTGGPAWNYAEHVRRSEGRRLVHAQCEAELLGYLSLATRRVSRTPDSEQWRYRSASDEIDLLARVVREGDVALVVWISVRPYTRSPRKRRAPVELSDGEKQVAEWLRAGAAGAASQKLADLAAAIESGEHRRVTPSG